MRIGGVGRGISSKIEREGLLVVFRIRKKISFFSQRVGEGVFKKTRGNQKPVESMRLL